VSWKSESSLLDSVVTKGARLEKKGRGGREAMAKEKGNKSS